MKAIYANYLIPYLTGIAAFFILWMGTIFIFDGILPFLTMLLFGAWFILGIPYLLYTDYRNVKKYMSGNPSIPNVVGEVVKKFGVPELLANTVVKSVEAKMAESKQPTKLEKHG